MTGAFLFSLFSQRILISLCSVNGVYKLLLTDQRLYPGFSSSPPHTWSSVVTFTREAYSMRSDKLKQD